MGDDMVQTIEVNMLHYNSIEQFADVIVTSSGADMPWPTLDDTRNKDSQVGEASRHGGWSLVDDEVDPKLGAKVWKAYKFKSSMIKVPHELIEDAAILLQFLPGMLGMRLGRIMAEKFTHENGASTDEGLLTAAAAGITTAAQGHHARRDSAFAVSSR